jgi:hypothetical protein
VSRVRSRSHRRFRAHGPALVLYLSVLTPTLRGGMSEASAQVGGASLVDGEAELGEELADPVVDVVDDAACRMPQ